MMRILKLVLPVTCLALTAACGGSGGGNGSSGGQSEFDLFEDRVLDAESQAGRLNKLPGTSWAAMPARGSADFKGSAGLIINPDRANEIVVIGDAAMTANFGTGKMTGNVTNMQGANNLTDTSGDLFDVGGTIRIGDSESVIGDDFDDNRTDLPNQWYADYKGTLTMLNGSYVVEGALDGEFRGTRVNPTGGLSVVRGIGAVDEDGFATVNGNREEVPVTFELIGENR